MPDGVPPEVIKSFEALFLEQLSLEALILRLHMMQTDYGTIHDFVYRMLGFTIKISWNFIYRFYIYSFCYINSFGLLNKQWFNGKWI